LLLLCISQSAPRISCKFVSANGGDVTLKRSRTRRGRGPQCRPAA
jgi:hypothetical protein